MIDRERALAIQQRALHDLMVFLGGAEPHSRLVERDGVTAAIVPATPTRSLPNSVTYADAGRLAASLDELAGEYESAGVDAWTVWTPDFDREAAAALEGAGHVLDGGPAAMILELDGFEVPDPGDLDHDSEADVATLGALNDVAYGDAHGPGLAPSFARRPEALDLRLYRALVGGEVASVLCTIDHLHPGGDAPRDPPAQAGPGGGPDCGIYFVATHPSFRGRGLATRLLAVALAGARERGCATSSLQASPMGEPLYAGLGYQRCFRLHMYERRN
ncbi:MAG: GNAT family N-acetyltransferase [Solirubrobacterales bacterium]|nr:GNAT family N-acetyltransferase [Solirubrobacterales bacterium]